MRTPRERVCENSLSLPGRLGDSARRGKGWGEGRGFALRHAWLLSIEDLTLVFVLHARIIDTTLLQSHDVHARGRYPGSREYPPMRRRFVVWNSNLDESHYSLIKLRSPKHLQCRAVELCTGAGHDC